MEELGVNPFILIGVVAALTLLILLARGRGPRRIGGGAREESGAVSRSGRSPRRSTPTVKTHTRHDKNWRTDSPQSPSKPKQAAAGSLHERMTRLQEMAESTGRKPTPQETLTALAGSGEAAKALPKVFRFAIIAIWVWIALWGFSAVMVVVSLINGDDRDAIFGLPVVIIPLAMGVAGLRAVRRFRDRALKKLAQGDH